MKFLKQLLFFLLVLFSCLPFAFSQETGIGQWRDLLPYREGRRVAEGPNRVYCSTPNSLFYFDKRDNSVQRMSKVWGLSDVGVSSIAFHRATNTLIIGYKNGNIDFIQDEQVFNLKAILISNVLGDKVINNIYFQDNLAYLACGFGIVVLDITRKEVRDTYFIGPNGAALAVNDIFIDEANIYATTNIGLYYAPLSSVNLSNFNSWTIDPSFPLSSVSLGEISKFNNALLVNHPNASSGADTLYQFDGVAWQIVPELLGKSNYSLEPNGDQLMVAHHGDVMIYDVNYQEVRKIFDYQTGDYPAPAHGIWGDNDVVWVADRRQGLIKNANVWDYDHYEPEGPYTGLNSGITINNNKVFVAAGGLDGAFRNLFNWQGVYFFEDGEWTFLNTTNSELYQNSGIRDVITVAVDPGNSNRIFAASYGWGVLEIENKELVQVYDHTNSTLARQESADSNFVFVGVGDVEFDINNNLWVSNALTNTAVHVMEPNGEWTGYDLSNVLNNEPMGEMIINQQNQKWIVMPRGGGVLVFDENRTIKNFNDDKAKRLTTGAGNGNLPSNQVLSIVEGLDGEIWVGTDKGVAVFFNPQNVFSNENFDAEQIQVFFDGFSQYLLETEIVTSLTIDGANRKWVGTDGSGVFLLSPDGKEQILHFTEDNSPLLSDEVLDVELNHLTGEVYISTSKGVIVYKGTATAPQASFDNIIVYPNPVRETFGGNIAIRGLVSETSVKITDINGNLVFETVSEGGQAVWDGRNLTGEKSGTGVYLVFCTDQNGNEKAVTKFLMVK